MAIQILSDLHLETPTAYDIFDIPPKAPYLAIFGDIGNIKMTAFSPSSKHNCANSRSFFSYWATMNRITPTGRPCGPK